MRSLHELELQHEFESLYELDPKFAALIKSKIIDPKYSSVQLAKEPVKAINLAAEALASFRKPDYLAGYDIITEFGVSDVPTGIVLDLKDQYEYVMYDITKESNLFICTVITMNYGDLKSCQTRTAKILRNIESSIIDISVSDMITAYFMAFRYLIEGSNLNITKVI